MPERQPPKAKKEPVQHLPYDHQDMLMNAPIGIFSSTPDGRLIYANSALAQIFGYDSPRELIDSIEDIAAQLYADPEDREEIRKLLAKNDERLNYESRFIRRDGSLFWASYNARAVRDEKGNIIYYQGFFSDITKRKQERESLLRTQFAMDRAPASILWVDEEGCIVYANDFACTSMGYTRDELLTMKIFDIDPDFPPDKWEQHKKETRRRGTRSFESRHRTKDGRFFPVEVSANYFKFQDRYLACAFDRDITERKRAEEELRKSEEKYRFLTESMSDIVCTLDLNLKTTYVSPSITKILGFTPEERMLQKAEEKMTWESYEMAMNTLARELEIERNGDVDPNRSVMIETEYYHKEGHSVWMESAVRWIRDHDGNPVGIHSLSRDITERKRTDEEREKLKEQLSRSQKLESIGTLAGGIAHDFNNLLMGIQGHASLMMLDLDPSHPHYVRLKQIEEQVRNGADLAGQLLGFARGGQYELKATDMNNIVKTTSSMFGRTKKEITIHNKYKKDLWIVEADRTQMGQVFMNLFVNAWQAMPGGGEIFLETDNFHVNDEGTHPLAPGKYVKITVSDTGMGMDTETRERIFDPFFTTKEMGRGTGLGLSTVYGIIKGHGGMIDVTSEPGQGTTFDIYLPVTEKAVVRETAASTEVLKGIETILLVDDEGMVLDVAREMLQSLGYRVHCAGNGQEAVSLYHEKKDKIDLVILDMIMPGMSGGETFDRLQEIDPKQKVLLSSGYSIYGKAREMLKKGCHGFLQKPFQLEELARQVRSILDMKEEQ